MLVLSRKKDEVIFIVNDNTGEVITIKNCGGGKIGLDGPQHYKFIREELYHRAKDRATSSPPETTPVVVDRKIHFTRDLD